MNYSKNHFQNLYGNLIKQAEDTATPLTFSPEEIAAARRALYIGAGILGGGIGAAGGFGVGAGSGLLRRLGLRSGSETKRKAVDTGGDIARATTVGGLLGAAGLPLAAMGTINLLSNLQEQ